MSGIKRSIAKVRLLRAALLVAFAALISLQPGLFAIANASATHAQTVAGPVVKGHDHHAASSIEHAHDAQMENGAVVDHHGVRKASGKSCQVHCAPAAALLVEYSPLPAPEPTSHATPALVVLTDGDAVEFIEPPRT